MIMFVEINICVYEKFIIRVLFDVGIISLWTI